MIVFSDTMAHEIDRLPESFSSELEHSCFSPYPTYASLPIDLKLSLVTPILRMIVSEHHSIVVPWVLAAP